MSGLGATHVEVINQSGKAVGLGAAGFALVRTCGTQTTGLPGQALIRKGTTRSHIMVNAGEEHWMIATFGAGTHSDPKKSR